MIQLPGLLTEDIDYYTEKAAEKEQYFMTEMKNRYKKREWSNLQKTTTQHRSLQLCCRIYAMFCILYIVHGQCRAGNDDENVKILSDTFALLHPSLTETDAFQEIWNIFLNRIQKKFFLSIGDLDKVKKVVYKDHNTIHAALEQDKIIIEEGTKDSKGDIIHLEDIYAAQRKRGDLNSLLEIYFSLEHGRKLTVGDSQSTVVQEPVIDPYHVDSEHLKQIYGKRSCSDGNSDDEEMEIKKPNITYGKSSTSVNAL